MIARIAWQQDFDDIVHHFDTCHEGNTATVVVAYTALCNSITSY